VRKWFSEEENEEKKMTWEGKMGVFKIK